MTDPIKWLTEARKLDAALLVDMGVRADQSGAAVALPYRRDGKPYAWKFRGVDEKRWWSSQGVQRDLFNADCLIVGDAPVVITEGEIDAMSCIQAGYTRSVSLPDGWTEDGGKRQVILDAEAQLRAAPYVIVAGDNDAAGASLPKTVANILSGCDVRYVRWPDGCKDANDVLVNFGEGKLSECLTQAKRIDPPGGTITGVSDMPPMPSRRVLRIGMNPYDHGLAFEVGAMSVATGTPGSGKSTFTTFAAFQIAVHEQIKVGIMAFETHPYEVRDHLSLLHSGTTWDDLSPTTRRDCQEFLDAHFRVVHRRFDEAQHNLEWLRQTVQTLAVRDGCKLIIVDPWNELEHLPEPGESMTAYINFALQQIRVWAEQYDTHICLVAHPRKMSTEGKPRAPTGYDIADSAAFFNKPSLGFSVHQVEEDDGESHVQILTWKVRNTRLYGFGRGSMKLRYLPARQSYAIWQSNAPYTRKQDQMA